ncbi:MAG: D-hexose-6-phosphate mutarotase [Verrucomicrobiota bacterium]
MSFPTNLEIPGVVTFASGNGGLSKVVIETPWSSAEIYLHGAHVTHFQKKGEAPLLFLSKASEFLSDKPIRGGVPVIFPWFGPREDLPAHGFARTVAWNLRETQLSENGVVRLLFALPPTEFFEVEYVVTVADTLTLELIVRNDSALDSVFETCLHTYFQISAIDAISITGLKNMAYLDKVKDVKALETAAAIQIDREVDRVYFNTTAAIEILDPGFKRTIRVEKSGSNSTVVWNPWIEKSQRMADFGDDEYLQMVCVESGNVAKNHITLPPGEIAVLKVVLSSEALA